MAGALRDFVLGGNNVCDAAAGASSSAGRFATQFLAGKGFEQAQQQQHQGFLGHGPGPGMNEAERIGNAPTMAPRLGGMLGPNHANHRALEEAWTRAATSTTASASSSRWMEEFHAKGGAGRGGGGGLPGAAAATKGPHHHHGNNMASPLPHHAEAFRCLNEPLRGFLHGDFNDVFNMTKDGQMAAAVHGVVQMLGMPGASKLRRRTDIIARQIFADRESVEPSHRNYLDQRSFVDRQVNALMDALRMKEVITLPPTPHQQSLEKAWGDAQAQPWVNDFSRQQNATKQMPQQYANGMADPVVPRPVFMPNRPVGPFFHPQPQRPSLTPQAEHWADDFSHRQQGEEVEQQAPAATDTAANPEDELLSHTRALEATMATSEEPKFRQSKFLNFVSKMNTGELKIVDEHLVDQSKGTQQQQQQGGEGWASEFSAKEQLETLQGSEWATEFDKFNSGPSSSWAEEHAKGKGPSTAEQWVEEFGDHYASPAPNAVNDNQRNYSFSNSNPFETTENPFELGQELYKNGILSEAALAFEAAIEKEVHVAESWRMLGMVHAENDDDKQAIASMVNAHACDPTNLDVLLDLGVSHTNELDTNEALNYMRQWISQHPEYKSAIALSSFQVNVVETIKMFESIGQANPNDADVFTALGVLYNLSKEYHKAEDAFRHGLSLQPDNHSLWNKLGATQANSSNSKDAVEAYQRALNIKPNYVRAWSNMGIGFSNQGMYKESIPYYVRALSMNVNAEPLWGYLKIAMACSGLLELLPLVNHRNIGALTKEFPI